MKVCQLEIERFRGIRKSNLLFPDHVVLIGDNNTGKSTVFEAIDLALGPDRLNRRTVIDEHDFYLGEYLKAEREDPIQIKIEITIADLSEEQRNRFIDYIEWWDTNTNSLHTVPPAESVDAASIEPAIRVTFIGFYDEEEDDFSANTYFSRSLDESDTPQIFKKKDKQFCGFLYLRSLRTGSRALSLEHGSLLDIILRLKEIRPQMWEKTITEIGAYDVASDPELGISGVLESIEAAIKKYVPREWGVTPHLKVSNLTREHLRKIVTAFIATGEGEHAAPYYRQGTGTINMLVLAMLSQIAEDKQNVIFAMEEPETAIPPYAQKRIIHEVRNLSVQSLFTSHSPYVLEEFGLSETLVLTRGSDGELKQSKVKLPKSIKHKRYRREFRTTFCEGLLSRRIIVAEGATEASALPVAARRLSEINPGSYSSFEALGLCTIDAGTESQIVDLAKLYRGLGKQVFAVCDKQTQENQDRIEAHVDQLFMHDEQGFEDLVLKNTPADAINRFIDQLEWPPHLETKFPDPKADAINALFDYFRWSKGNWGIAEFLSQCTEDEFPEWIKETCQGLQELCEQGQAEKPDDEDSDEDLGEDNENLD